MFPIELQVLVHHVRNVLDDSYTASPHTGDPDLDIALAAARRPTDNNEVRGALLRPFWVSGDTSVYAGHADYR